jgi:hypothetical protein
MRVTRKRATSVPKPARSAEIVVRQGFVINASGEVPSATPELILLANAEGLKYLSELFAHLAGLAKSRSGSAEALLDLPREGHPINARLSDDLAIRLAALSPTNRKAMFKRFGIDMKSRQEGSLFERYQEVVTQFSRLAGRMKAHERRAAQRAERLEA